jgi:CheY-like chemotaxis protein
MSKYKALIIEDTKANRIFFERFILSAGYDVISVETGKAALDQTADLADLALAIVDMEIPDSNGLDMTAELRERFPVCCIVVATMHDERSLMQSAYDKGCDVFLVKPHGFMDLFKKLTSDGSAHLHQNRPFVIDKFGLRPFELAVT